MANFLQLLALLLSVCNAVGLFFGPPSWNSIDVTWGLVGQQDNFGPMPLTKQAAINKGFVPVDPPNTPCASAKFMGYRYIKPNDSAIIMLYDKNGYVCGLQSGYHQNALKSFEVPWFKSQPMFNMDTVANNATYTLTAYLYPPDLICTTGRTQEEYNASPSGAGLYLQNGPDLSNVITISLLEGNIDQTVWTKETCILSMGQHYWHNISVNMDCNTLLPCFVMYNRGVLTGFGFVALTNSAYYSDRFEHPPQILLNAFFKTVPTCLTKAFTTSGGITTMHVFMNDQIENLYCDLD